jgi:hypothetical protein
MYDDDGWLRGIPLDDGENKLAGKKLTESK